MPGTCVPPAPKPPVLPQGRAPVPKACWAPSGEEEEEGDEDAIEQPGSAAQPQQLPLVSAGYHKGGDSGDTPRPVPSAPAGHQRWLRCQCWTSTRRPVLLHWGGAGSMPASKAPPPSVPKLTPKRVPSHPLPQHLFSPGDEGIPAGVPVPAAPRTTCHSVGGCPRPPCRHPWEVTPPQHREGTASATPSAAARRLNPHVGPHRCAPSSRPSTGGVRARGQLRGAGGHLPASTPRGRLSHHMAGAGCFGTGLPGARATSLLLGNGEARLLKCTHSPPPPKEAPGPNGKAARSEAVPRGPMSRASRPGGRK